MTTTPGSGRVIFAPMPSMMESKIRTSEISGTFSIRQGPATSSAAGKMATTAFFAPLMVTQPSRGLPPLISYLAKEINSLRIIRSYS